MNDAPLRQAPLFDDRSKIIPFPRDPASGRNGGRRRQGSRRESRSAEPPTSSHPGMQAPLDLRPPAPQEKKAVNDDAPVARPAARLQAALLDAGFVAAGMGLAALAFYVAGGRFQWSGKVVAPYLGACLALAVFYHLFWAVLGRESAGMRLVGLRSLTFDGQPPGWRRLTFRFVFFCLGVGAVGVGLLWALVDDEALTMHDHMSKTFPTRHDPHPSTLRRR
ncbi:MAG TPA: RDD family protein [Bryobacteraceae bacterium]|nr:RDD family protein [Bryobacteraceae bacterium]